MQTSTQAVRARTDEPFLERFIEAHEAFVLRCASRHAGFAVTRSDDEYWSRCWPSTKPSRATTRQAGRSARMRRW